LLLGVLFAVAVLAQTTELDAFKQFQLKFNKTYSTEVETNLRFENFKMSIKNIEEMNALKSTATFGITQFADMTKAEFKDKMLMKTYPKPSMLPLTKFNVTGGIPAAFDWTTHGVVTPVYNQGQCGSCWAFSATECIESQWALAGHGLVELSMQQIVDCDDEAQHGCAGGSPSQAMQYVHDQGGIDRLADYPYIGANGRCHYNPSWVGARIAGWELVTATGNEDVMAEYLVARGPISICVDAEQWQYYTGGVVAGDVCDRQIDHCVLLTGYNLAAGNDYWIVRNSWGTSFGYSGYILLQFGTNTCGMAEDPTCAVV